VQTRFNFGRIGHTEETRKLSLRKETLRQLTDGELRHVAGGGLSISLTPSASVSASTSFTPSTSASPSTSAHLSV
jgi:hypothetical protein